MTGNGSTPGKIDSSLFICRRYFSIVIVVVVFFSIAIINRIGYLFIFSLLLFFQMKKMQSILNEKKMYCTIYSMLLSFQCNFIFVLVQYIYISTRSDNPIYHQKKIIAIENAYKIKLALIKFFSLAGVLVYTRMVRWFTIIEPVNVYRILFLHM